MIHTTNRLFVYILAFCLSISVLRASQEWNDFNPEEDTWQLPPFEVNGNDPDTFDWDGYYDWLDDMGVPDTPDPFEDFEDYDDFWDWVRDVDPCCTCNLAGERSGVRGNYNQAEQSDGWYHNRQGFTFQCGSSAEAWQKVSDIASDISRLASLNDPGVNNTSFTVIGDGSSGSFAIRGLDGLLSDWSGNDENFRVTFERETDRDGNRFVQTATTEGDHPLVGTRQWTVERDPSTNQVHVYTEAWDQPRNWLNEQAYESSALQPQRDLWNVYFDNLKENYSLNQSTGNSYENERVSSNPFYDQMTNSCGCSCHQ